MSSACWPSLSNPENEDGDEEEEEEEEEEDQDRVSQSCHTMEHQGKAIANKVITNNTIAIEPTCVGLIGVEEIGVNAQASKIVGFFLSTTCAAEKRWGKSKKRGGWQKLVEYEDCRVSEYEYPSVRGDRWWWEVVVYLTIQLGNCRRIVAAKAMPQYPKPKIKTCLGTIRSALAGGSFSVCVDSAARCSSSVRGWIDDKNALVSVT